MDRYVRDITCKYGTVFEFVRCQWTHLSVIFLPDPIWALRQVVFRFLFVCIDIYKYRENEVIDRPGRDIACNSGTMVSKIYNRVENMKLTLICDNFDLINIANIITLYNFLSDS